MAPRPGPSCTAGASSSMKCSAEPSCIACTASMRRPSKWNSSIQYSALWMKKLRTVRLPGPSKLMAAPQGVCTVGLKKAGA